MRDAFLLQPFDELHQLERHRAECPRLAPSRGKHARHHRLLVHVEPTTPLVHRLHGNHLLTSIGGGGMAAAQSKTFPSVLLPPMGSATSFRCLPVAGPR